jgi:hypothetical protein
LNDNLGLVFDATLPILLSRAWSRAFDAILLVTSRYMEELAADDESTSNDAVGA